MAAELVVVSIHGLDWFGWIGLGWVVILQLCVFS